MIRIGSLPALALVPVSSPPAVVSPSSPPSLLQPAMPRRKTITTGEGALELDDGLNLAAQPLCGQTDHDPAALGQRLAPLLGLAAPHDDGEERRLPLPPAADGRPEHGPGDPVVGEVAGSSVKLPAKLRLPRSWCCPPGLPGRAVCLLWNRRTVDTGDAGETRGRPWSRGSRPDWIRLPSGLGSVPGWLVEGLRLGGVRLTGSGYGRVWVRCLSLS